MQEPQEMPTIRGLAPREVAHLYRNASKGKHNFLDLLETLDMENTWEYEEIIGWSEPMFLTFSVKFDFNFRDNRFSKQLDDFIKKQLVLQ